MPEHEAAGMPGQPVTRRGRARFSVAGLAADFGALAAVRAGAAPGLPAAAGETVACLFQAFHDGRRLA